MVPHVRWAFFRKLAPLCADVCPFDKLLDATIPLGRWSDRKEIIPVQCIDPTVVVQIQFHEWTADDRLRFSSHIGLRDDKMALEVRREL
jgi:ATP-dependent DNA ligase